MTPSSPTLPPPTQNKTNEQKDLTGETLTLWKRHDSKLQFHTSFEIVGWFCHISVPQLLIYKKKKKTIITASTSCTCQEHEIKYHADNLGRVPDTMFTIIITARYRL